MPSHPTLRFPTLALSSTTAGSSTFKTASKRANSTGDMPSFQISSKVERIVFTSKRQTATAAPSTRHAMMQTSLPMDEDEENQQDEVEDFPRKNSDEAPKKRVFGSDKIPSLNRSSSAVAASATASRFVSKMAPMLRRVVSGTTNNTAGTAPSTVRSSKSNNSAFAQPASPHHNFLDSSDEEGDRDSLLFMMQVPVVRRNSHIPLMAISHSEN
uniref:Uncharacterized protein n=1 Tax=Globisporangium ultimum (strain ATCC 200006 / CBS 805.95 / DAOM BR144) TaxID=431595 RepID=K3WLS2_GLOUD